MKIAEKPLSRLATTAFEHHHKALYRFLARRLHGTQADAADVLQEVFLRLLRLPDADFVRDPQAYLYGMASRVLHELRAKAQYNRVTFDSEAVEQRTEHPPEIAPDELADWIGTQRQVERALGELSHMHFKVLMAEVRDGLTHPEIAVKLGLSTHTVKKYSVQALAHVRLGWDNYRRRGPSAEGSRHDL